MAREKDNGMCGLAKSSDHVMRNVSEGCRVCKRGLIGCVKGG